MRFLIGNNPMGELIKIIKEYGWSARLYKRLIKASVSKNEL